MMLLHDASLLTPLHFRHFTEASSETPFTDFWLPGALARAFSAHLDRSAPPPCLTVAAGARVSVWAIPRTDYHQPTCASSLELPTDYHQGRLCRVCVCVCVRARARVRVRVCGTTMPSGHPLELGGPRIKETVSAAACACVCVCARARVPVPVRACAYACLCVFVW